MTVASVTVELIPFLLDDNSWKQDLEPSRVSVMPDCAGYPLEIVGVCLPFVLVRTPSGAHGTLDLRRHRVVRLSSKFAKMASKRIRANHRVKTSECGGDG